MSWFNYFGLIIFILMMIPNIIYSLRHKEAFENKSNCKCLEIAEQVGRYGSTVFLIFNIPLAYIGWFFDDGKLVYLLINGLMLAAYLITWIIMWKKNNLTRTLLLSILPSLIFLFSGIMILSYPLILFGHFFHKQFF